MSINSKLSADLQRLLNLRGSDNMTDKAEQIARSLSDELRYIASILEANASKFTVPDHISQKAHKCREAADRLEALEHELAESQS